VKKAGKWYSRGKVNGLAAACAAGEAMLGLCAEVRCRIKLLMLVDSGGELAVTPPGRGIEGQRVTWGGGQRNVTIVFIC
jgi:hypothetical protein